MRYAAGSCKAGETAQLAHLSLGCLQMHIAHVQYCAAGEMVPEAVR